MRVLEYEGIDKTGLEPQVERVVEALERGDFRAAHMKKLAQGGFYRAELGYKDRLLIQLRSHQGQGVALLLEVIRNHAYQQSRFLGGARVDEARVQEGEVPDPAEAQGPELPHLPATARSFRLLDKVLVWDEAQGEAFRAPCPMVLIGSAGSGKTALALERLKEKAGRVLYVTRSDYLAEHARRVYHANGFFREDQDAEFLSFREFVETLEVPEGREAQFADFRAFFQRHARTFQDLDAHAVHEEFKGVLTGFPVDRPFLDREAYMALGIRQSIFPEERRTRVYDLFEKYLEYLKANGLFETNLVAHQHLATPAPAYDFAIVDELQDLTNVQLALLLSALKKPGEFILCGDANQIVHPNFFSWAHLKSFFFERPGLAGGGLTRILDMNFRNADAITALANRLLRIKQRRFGSIDRESHFLARSLGTLPGEVAFMENTAAMCKELDRKTSRSTHFAVVVLRDEDKAKAASWFSTPLVFSIFEAKGLEYENVILLDFVSSQRQTFKEIAADLSPADLEGAFEYGRARSKEDRSMEAFKFFVNSLYVGITRAVRNLYWLEADPGHPFLALMGMEAGGQAREVEEQKSTREEWERESRRLEAQGRLAQARAIHQTRLGHTPVPWQVLDAQCIEEAVAKALPPRSVSSKMRERFFDWAVLSAEPLTLTALARHGFPEAPAALQKREKALAKATALHRRALEGTLAREIEAHGVDYRTPFNHTPLMLAARAGNARLVQALLDRGADPDLVDTRGWTAFLHALDQTFCQPRGEEGPFGPILDVLAPGSLSLASSGQLQKLDRRQGEYLLVQCLMVLQGWTLPLDEDAGFPGLTSAGLAQVLERLPPDVVPPYRCRRPYINAMLARHEGSAPAQGNRRLFHRTERGRYMLDPGLEIRIGESFHMVVDLLFPPAVRPYTRPAIREFLEDPRHFVTPARRQIEQRRAERERERVQREEAQARWREENADWLAEREKYWAAERARKAQKAEEKARKAEEVARRAKARQVQPQLPRLLDEE